MDNFSVPSGSLPPIPTEPSVMPPVMHPVIQPTTPIASTSESEPSKKKSLLFIIPAIIILITLVVCASIIYNQNKVASTPKMVSKIPITPTSVFGDGFFNKPGWRQANTSVSADGKQLIITYPTIEESFMYFVSNETTLLPIEKDFEVRMQVVPGDKSANPKNDNYYWGIILNSFNDIKQYRKNNYYSLALRSNSADDSFTCFINGHTNDAKSVDLGKGVLPKNGDLIFKFHENSLTLVDAKTQKEIFNSELPYKFYRPRTKLIFTFEIGNGLQNLTIKNLVINL